MPSTVWTGGLSGPQLLISGNPYSGQLAPLAGVLITPDPITFSGIAVYFGFSGNIVVNSGGEPLSGGGLADGFPVLGGQTLFVPKSVLRGVASGAGGVSSGMAGTVLSGQPFNIFFNAVSGTGAANAVNLASGIGRVFWELDIVRK